MKEGTYVIRNLQSTKIDKNTTEVQTTVAIAGKGDSSAYLSSGAQGDSKNFTFIVKNESGNWKIDSFR